MLDTEFYHWMKVLAFLHKHDNECLSGFTISKGAEINSTSSIFHITRLLEEKKFIKIEKYGRVNRYIMTEKGKKVGDTLVILFQLVRD